MSEIDEAFSRAILTHRLASIAVSMETYGTPLVTATLERHRRLAVSAIDGDFLGALNSALEVLEKVKVAENELDRSIEPPPDSAQPYDSGYHAEKLMEGSDREVMFKRQGARFVITDIRRKDSDGYYWLDEPLPTPKDMKFVRMLLDGCELWTWNDIGILSGSAGEAIVKDGKVIKTRTTMVS